MQPVTCNACGLDMCQWDYWHMSHAWCCVYRLKRSPMPDVAPQAALERHE
jgi:hypothetical protein